MGMESAEDDGFILHCNNDLQPAERCARAQHSFVPANPKFEWVICLPIEGIKHHRGQCFCLIPSCESFPLLCFLPLGALFRSALRGLQPENKPNHNPSFRGLFLQPTLKIQEPGQPAGFSLSIAILGIPPSFFFLGRQAD